MHTHVMRQHVVSNNFQVFENEIISKHKIMCPPHVYGEIVKIYGGGTDGKDQFHVNEPIMEVYNEAQDRTHILNLSHFWPVRRPRPSSTGRGCAPGDRLRARASAGRESRART